MIFPEYIPFKQLPELTDKDLQNITFDEHGDLYFKNALLQYSLNANHERCINYQGNLTHAGLILFKLIGYSIIDRHIQSYKKIIHINGDKTNFNWDNLLLLNDLELSHFYPRHRKKLYQTYKDQFINIESDSQHLWYGNYLSIKIRKAIPTPYDRYINYLIRRSHQIENNIKKNGFNLDSNYLTGFNRKIRITEYKDWKTTKFKILMQRLDWYNDKDIFYSKQKLKKLFSQSFSEGKTLSEIKQKYAKQYNAHKHLVIKKGYSTYRYNWDNFPKHTKTETIINKRTYKNKDDQSLWKNLIVDAYINDLIKMGKTLPNKDTQLNIYELNKKYGITGFTKMTRNQIYQIAAKTLESM